MIVDIIYTACFISADFMSGEEFPDHVKVELRKLNDKEEADRKQKEMDKSTCKVCYICFQHLRLRICLYML
jgi:hypothetical protein